jgi:hypothetical protein
MGNKSGSDADLDSLKLICVRFYSTATMQFLAVYPGLLIPFEIIQIPSIEAVVQLRFP